MKRTILTLGMMFAVFLLTAQTCPPTTPLTTPYFEDFDAESAGQTGTYANCWVATTTSDPNWETESSGTANSSNTGPLNDVSGSGIYVYMETSGGSLGDTAGLISPPIDLSNLTVPELTFYYHMFGATMGDLRVQIWDGTTWTNELTISGQQQTAETDPWAKGIVGLSNYSGTIRIKFLGDKGSSFTGDMSIDEVSVAEAPTCPQPTNLRATTVNALDATLKWNTVANASGGYDVIYGTAGFNPATGGTTLNSTNDSVVLTGLSGATTYEAYVLADCGAVDGLSDTTGPLSFTTLCVPLTSPYFRNFDSDATGAPALCWAQKSSWSASAYARVENSPPFVTPFSGANVLEMYNFISFTATDTLAAISPQFSDLTASDKQVRFQAAASVSGTQLIVATTSSQSGNFPINVIDTITFNASSTWQEYIVTLDAANGYNGTDEYVVLQYLLNTSLTVDYIFIDDFRYEPIPPCPQPTQVGLANVTTSSVDVNFSGSATTLDYEFGPIGFSQGTGTTGQISGPNFTISGLTSATCYDVYVRSNCTAGGSGTSIWVGPFTFCTACNVQSLPYTENFNNTLGCFTVIDGGTSPDTWVQVPAGGNGNYFGDLDGTGHVSVDSDGAGSGPTLTETLLSPYIDASNLSGTLFLEWDQFYDHLGSSASVDVWDGSSWQNVFFENAADRGSFIAPDNQKIDITAFANDSLRVRFVYDDQGAWAWWWLVDNFSVTEVLCNQATNFQAFYITPDSVGLTWTPGGGLNFGLEYGTSGFTPGTGTSLATTNDTIFIGGLTPNTVYDFYVTDTCAGGSASPVTGPLTVQTRCSNPGPTLLPWSDGFENYTSGPTFQGSTNLCNPNHNWEFQAESASGRMRLQAGAAFYNSGSQAATLDHSPAPANREFNYLTLTVNLSNYTMAGGINLGFFFMNHGQESGPENRVWARGSYADPWVEILNLENLSTGTGVYDSVGGVDIKAPLNAAGQNVGPTTQIRFGQGGRFTAFSTTFSDGYSFDDISLEAVSCPNPSNISSAPTDTSVTLSWNSSVASNSNEVWFGPSGFFQGTLTTGGVRTVVSGNSLLIDTLRSKVCYEFLVRSICGAGDSSAWVGPFTFCTACSPFFATYAENFDGPNMTTGQEPDCWTAILQGTNTQFSAAEVYAFGGPRSAPNHIRFYNYNNSLTMLVSPLMGDLTAGDKRVSFYARESFGGGETVLVGTVPGPNSPGQFDTIASFTTTTTDQRFFSFITPANGYNGTDQYLAILHGNTSTFSTIYIDDFVYEVIPSCPEPLSGQLINATDKTAEVSFVPGGASNHQIVYGAPGFSPSGSSANLINATNDTVTITGLTANTNYEWYVRDSCGVGDVSVWTGPFSFQTLCSPFTAPYFQDFENGTLGHVEGLDDCWVLLNTVPSRPLVSSGYGWELRNSSQTTSGTGTGPDRDNTLAPAIGGQFWNADVSYGTAGDSSMLVSPIVDISGLSNPELEYHLHRLGSNMADFYVDIYDGTQWVNGVHSYTSLSGIQSAQSDPYTDTIIDLSPYAGITNFQVRFRTVSNGCCAGDNALDDIRISDPISGDLDVVEADFVKSLCLNNNDSIDVTIVNTVATPADLSTYPLNLTYDVTGPVNTNGTFTVNSGSIPASDSLFLRIGGIDLSQPGSYNLEVYIDTSFINVFRNRDTLRGITLDVQDNLNVSPKTVTVGSVNDSVELCASSAFFGGGEFKITEICHFRTTSGSPTGGWPSYFDGDDYIEISGSPNADLSGYVLEQWSTTALSNTHTFPQGTVLSPNGTAIVIVGSGTGTSQPANFYYYGNTALGHSSGSTQGRILKDPNGNIVDAVGYGPTSYSFPATANVGTAWSGGQPSATGTAGIRLDGPDTDDGTNWIVSSTSPQDPNVFNANVPAIQAASSAGFAWTLGGVTVDTLACFMAGGPFPGPGTYQYVATYTNSCGTFSDTATVIVPNCSAPTNPRGYTLSSTSVALAWDTVGTGGQTFDVEYGAPGFMLGSGTRTTLVGDSTVLTGLALNVCQDFYVRANCSAQDTSAWVGPINVCPNVSICGDDVEGYATGLIEGQSALFLPWQGVTGAGGTASVSTAQASSGSQSINLSNPSGSAATHDDIVAYFDTISNGAWEISFDLYVPTGNNAYFNIQQNHVINGVGTNLWGGEVYLQGNGNAEVQYSTGTIVAGTFNYTQGQWFTMSTIIDLDNDSIWFEVNGTSVNVGYRYSLANAGQPLQFNGVNFFTGVLAGDITSSNFYVDDFCVSPAVIQGTCAPVNGFQSTTVACDSVTLDWISNTGGSIVEYGTAPLTPGTGTFSGIVTPPYTITGLTPGVNYDFRVADTCGNDTSSFRTLNETTATGPLPTASFTVSTAIVGGQYEVYVDASNSSGASGYAWDYGNGTNGTGVLDTGVYTVNGPYTITLTVTNGCGSATATRTVNVNIGVIENALDGSLTVFPNPAKEAFTVRFDEVGSAEVSLDLKDAQGRSIRRLDEKLQSGTFEQRIDVSELPAGVYFLEVRSGELSAQRRITVRK